MPRREYAQYPRNKHRDWLMPVLRQLQVHVSWAVRWKTTSRWDMKTRQLPFDYFLYVTSGRGNMRIEERKLTLAPGDCVHIHRNVPHSASSDSRVLIEFTTLRYAATVFGSLSVSEMLGFPDVIHLAGDHIAANLFDTACREFVMRPVGFEAGLAAIGTQLLLHLIREHGEEMNPHSHPTRVADLHRLLPALQTMHANLEKPLYVPSLAKQAGLSPTHFRRVFQKAMGTSPIEHLRRIRIDRACMLLCQTHETVESISAQVGYEQVSFFNHTFKKRIGMSPGKYRKAHEV